VITLQLNPILILLYLAAGYCRFSNIQFKFQIDDKIHWQTVQTLCRKLFLQGLVSTTRFSLAAMVTQSLSMDLPSTEIPETPGKTSEIAVCGVQ